MVTTLTGTNSYTLGKVLRGHINNFVAEHDELALERLDGEEADIARISEALQSLPFLSVRKLVVLDRPSANKQFVETAETMLEAVSDTTDVILVEPKLDKRLAYYKLLKKQTDFLEFPELDAGGLARWLSESAKEQGGKLNPADARYLVDRVGAEQRRLSNELDKLLLYNSNITRQTIDQLTEANPQSTVFQLLEAAFAGNHKRVLDLYKEQRAQKVEPQQIIAMLAWQLHILALVKTAGTRNSPAIAKEAKLSPYVVDKTRAIARNVDLPRLKTLVANLLDIDTRSKRTALDLDEALQLYLLKLSK